ncbi:OsmC family protein [Shouchella shacheensis]|uniref:OsmC family protein n=1 Tax=Shouchella shacheensis TaxID=1649580 RepID=UPI00073FEB69|nr:OsmC family protein [Shouchella shacheensis]
MADKMTFQVNSTSEGMRTDIEAGQHKIAIDEPENMGGKDSATDPLSTLLGSLAGCENVIANLVAKDIHFDLQGISFDIKGELDPRGLMGDPDVRPYFQKVSIEANVQTSETEERIQELQEKTDQRCPVYTTLEAAGVELHANWRKA